MWIWASSSLHYDGAGLFPDLCVQPHPPTPLSVEWCHRSILWIAPRIPLNLPKRPTRPLFSAHCAVCDSSVVDLFNSWCWTNIIYRLKSLREAKIAPVRTDHPTVTVHEVGSWYGNHTEYDATYQPVSSFLSPPPQQLRGPITQRIPAQFLLLRLVVLSALTVIDKLSQPNDGAAKRPLERKL